MTLRAHIIKALTGTTGQHPVALHALRKIAKARRATGQELDALLDQLYAERIANRALITEDGQQYTAYWQTCAPLRTVIFRISQPDNKPQPASVPKVQAKPAKPVPPPTKATPAAKPRRPAGQPRPGRIGIASAAMLQHITDHPGLGRTDLIQWAVQHIEDMDRDKAISTLGNLRTRKAIEASLEYGKKKYYAHGTVPDNTPILARAIRTTPIGHIVERLHTEYEVTA